METNAEDKMLVRSLIEERITMLKEELNCMRAALAEERKYKVFKCVCGKVHMLIDCDAIQTHSYIPPSGCSDGDYWVRSDVMIACPETDMINRVYFSRYDRPEGEGEAREKRFTRIYSPLFKSFTDNHDKWSGGYPRVQNNTSFDEDADYYRIEHEDVI